MDRKLFGLKLATLTTVRTARGVAGGARQRPVHGADAGHTGDALRVGPFAARARCQCVGSRGHSRTDAALHRRSGLYRL